MVAPIAKVHKSYFMRIGIYFTYLSPPGHYYLESGVRFDVAQELGSHYGRRAEDNEGFIQVENNPLTSSSLRSECIHWCYSDRVHSM